jgi:hypothetical protein
LDFTRELPEFKIVDPARVQDWYPRYVAKLEAVPGITVCTPGVFADEFELLNARYIPTNEVVASDTKWGPISFPGRYIEYEYSMKLNAQSLLAVTTEWKKYPEFKNMLTHRGRAITMSDRTTQLNELNLHRAWNLLSSPHIGNGLIIDPHRDIYKDAWMSFVEKFAGHYVRTFSPWYQNRETSLFSGRKWNQVWEDQITEELNFVYDVSELWFQQYLAAMNEEQYLDMLMYNFGMRCRPFDFISLEDILRGWIRRKVRCHRTRIVMFKYGSSTAGSGCNCATQSDHTEWISRNFKENIVDKLGASNVDGPLINGAKAYWNYFNLMNQGWHTISVDGKRWESSVASIGGYLASGISTKIGTGQFIEASGTIFTTDYNTFIWIAILHALGWLGRDDIRFFIHGDDLNIVAKLKDVLDECVKQLLALGIADSDEWDTRLGFYLGMCKPLKIRGKQGADYMAHMVGIKSMTDSVDNSSPVVLNQPLKNDYTFSERMIVPDIYTGSIDGVDLLKFYEKGGGAGMSHEGIKTSMVRAAIEESGKDIRQFQNILKEEAMA